MNIHAKKGELVVFTHPDAGYDSHQEKARKFLEEGKTYTVERTVVDAWHTDVYLQEVPGEAFNSVHFSDILSDWFPKV